MKTLNLKLVWLTLLVLIGFRASATLLYDTYPNYNGNAFTMTNTQELGNELFFGNSILLTNFNFEYYSPTTPTFSGSVGVQLTFYANDGPLNSQGYATPGTVLYSNVFLGPLPANGFQTVTYDTNDFGSLLLPSDFTFTLSFQGLDPSDTMQLPLANPTNSFGVSYGDYWYNGSSEWGLLTNAAPASLLVSISGIETVPEPSILYLSTASGALLMLGAARLRRKRASKSLKAE